MRRLLPYRTNAARCLLRTQSRGERLLRDQLILRPVALEDLAYFEQRQIRKAAIGIRLCRRDSPATGSAACRTDRTRSDWRV